MSLPFFFGCALYLHAYSCIDGIDIQLLFFLILDVHYSFAYIVSVIIVVMYLICLLTLQPYNNLIIAIADIDVTLSKVFSCVIGVISHIPHLQPLQFDVEG